MSKQQDKSISDNSIYAYRIFMKKPLTRSEYIFLESYPNNSLFKENNTKWFHSYVFLNFFFVVSFGFCFIYFFLLLLLLLEIIVFSYLFFFFCCLALKFISLLWAQAFSRTMPVESQFIGQKDKTWTANSPLFVAHSTTLYIENRTIFSNHTKLNWKNEKEKIKKKNCPKNLKHLLTEWHQMNHAYYGAQLYQVGTTNDATFFSLRLMYVSLFPSIGL